MSEPYIREIVAVGFYFGSGFSNGNTWLPCNGNRVLGQQVGAMTETLSIGEMPSQNHGVQLGKSASGGTPGLTTQSVAIDAGFNGFVPPPGRHADRRQRRRL